MGRTGRVIVVFLLVIVAVGPLLLRPRSAATGDDVPRLVVITPHNEQIRHEIAVAFARWHEQNFAQPAAIDWRAGSGTSDIERILISEYGALLRQDRMDDGIGYDVLFGGGDYFFTQMKLGVHRQHTILEPVRLEAGFLSEVYPEPNIADKPLYDSEGYWFGVVLSSFGIVFNRDVLDDLGIERDPATWSDLADPRLIGQVALADPSHSGSVRVTYDAIVQRYGWVRGIRTLRRVSANARYFANSSSKVPIDVAAGNAAAGMCIDFYGRYQAQIMGDDRCRYIAPPDATVITADPVAVLRGTQNKELATRFVMFLLSREGQAIWCYRTSEPGGPQTFELRRPPVRRDMYDNASLPRMTDPVDPFALALPLAPDTPSYFAVIPTVLHAMAIDTHDDLRAAWRAIADEPRTELRQQMIELFDELPFTQEQLLAAPARWRQDPDARDRDRMQWARFFQQRYQRIAEMK